MSGSDYTQARMSADRFDDLLLIDRQQVMLDAAVLPVRPVVPMLSRAPTFEPGGSGAFDSGENSYSA